MEGFWLQPLWAGRQSSIRSSSPPAASRLECILQQNTDHCHQMQPKVAKLASISLCDERFEELNTRMINTTNRTVSRSYQNGLNGTRFITNSSSKTFLLNRKELIYFFIPTHWGWCICSSSPPPAAAWPQWRRTSFWLSMLLLLLPPSVPHRPHATWLTWLHHCLGRPTKRETESKFTALHD